MKPAIKVIGVPNDINSSFMRGSSAAPPLIREALYSASSNLFSESGLNLDQKGIWEDLGDIEFAGEVAVENFKKIKTFVRYFGCRSKTYFLRRRSFGFVAHSRRSF